MFILAAGFNSTFSPKRKGRTLLIKRKLLFWHLCFACLTFNLFLTAIHGQIPSFWSLLYRVQSTKKIDGLILELFIKKCKKQSRNIGWIFLTTLKLRSSYLIKNTSNTLPTSVFKTQVIDWLVPWSTTFKKTPIWNALTPRAPQKSLPLEKCQMTSANFCHDFTTTLQLSNYR